MRLPEFELERYFARYEFELPHLLGSSDIENRGLKARLQRAQQALCKPL